MDFNFQSYLANLASPSSPSSTDDDNDNSHGYEIEVLTGGLVNVTVRARVVSSSGSSAPASAGILAEEGKVEAEAESEGERESEREVGREREMESAGLKPPPQTMILKYAPPFVAALGEGAPFTRDRQVCFFFFFPFFEVFFFKFDFVFGCLFSALPCRWGCPSSCLVVLLGGIVALFSIFGWVVYLSKVEMFSVGCVGY